MKLNFIKYLKQKLAKKSINDEKIEKFIYQISGYKLKKIEIYRLAFNHKSLKTNSENNNERLEFLGDSILQTTVSQYLYRKFPQLNEGQLTKLRSVYVKRELLNKLGDDFKVLSLLRYSDSININKTKNLSGNTLEAVIAAIYLDLGFKKCNNFIISKILIPNDNLNKIKNEICSKSQLIIWSQKEKKDINFKYEYKIQSNNNISFKVELYVDNQMKSTGIGNTKKAAERNAANKFFHIKE